ncbi:hypothetical protein EDD85DRAFT_249997 [Armillaria nabsnona]|nr:hypothetical protein EDD85DRAFT_249997 [Armillaria nabsnona]
MLLGLTGVLAHLVTRSEQNPNTLMHTACHATLNPESLPNWPPIFISPFIHVILGYPCLISETYCSRVATGVGRGQDRALSNGCSSERTRFSQVKESNVWHHFFMQRAGIHTLHFHQEAHEECPPKSMLPCKDLFTRPMYLFMSPLSV